MRGGVIYIDLLQVVVVIRGGVINIDLLKVVGFIRGGVINIDLLKVVGFIWVICNKYFTNKIDLQDI
jgi:hypothetical protein